MTKGQRQGVGLALLLVLPTVLAVLLARWFDSARPLAASTPPGPGAETNAVSNAQTLPAAVAAKATRNQAQQAQVAPASTSNFYPGGAYIEALERRRQQRLAANHETGSPDAEWTAEVQSFMREAVEKSLPGGALLSVDCRTTICKAVVNFENISQVDRAWQVGPIKERDQLVYYQPSGETPSVTYYFARDGVQLKSITENQVR